MAATQAPPAEIPMRRACAEDEALLFELFAGDKRAEFAVFGVGGLQAEKLIEMQYRGRKLTYGAQYPGAEDSILLDEDGRAAGRLLVDRGAECWRIVDIAVLSGHRGKGMATAALRECQRRCAASGARLELQVAPMNPARRLYERAGFRATREDAMAVEMVWSAAD